MPLLLCQRDSYIRSVATNVVSCAKADGGYAVVLDETVLYPEGGGQPADHGTVAGFLVKALSRGRDGEVIHLVENPVVGRVEVAVDWARRYDHMQQHTAQHILTAIAQDRYGLATTAFHLGPERCDVELDTQAVPPDRLGAIEDEVNTVVRADLPVTVREVSPGELGALGVRMRGLPEGLTGAARVVEIVGVDRNTCGGTHVRRTAEVQAFKILDTEPMRGGTRVAFVAGGRVLALLDAMLRRERDLTGALSCGPAEHGRAAQRLADEAHRLSKGARALRLELAALLGAALAQKGPVAALHRDDGDQEFSRAIASEAVARRPGILVLVTAGADHGEGTFVLAGGDEQVKILGPRVAEVLGGRGGGGRGIFQGKATQIGRRAEALALLVTGGS